jgi:ABC-type amino acid transport substrate-binding protein
VIEYRSIDALLRTGIVGGEVDFALSSVTKTRARETRLGIRFTQGYFDSHLVLLGRGGSGSVITRDAEVGGIKKTTNEAALTEFCSVRHCTPVLFESFQDTVNALIEGTVKYILVDEPLSLQMIQQHQLEVVGHDLARDLPRYRELIGYPNDQYAIATPDEGLQRKLARLVDGLERDGAVQQLMKKYHLVERAP